MELFLISQCAQSRHARNATTDLSTVLTTTGVRPAHANLTVSVC